MELPEIKETLRNKNIYPIHVEDSVDEDDAKGLSFCGDLKEYLEAILILGCKILYIATENLEEENFSYTLKNRSYHENESEIEIEEIDLCQINADMHRFKEKIGQVGTFKLSTSMSGDSLNFYIHEEWWVDFVNVCYDTIQEVQAKKIEIFEKMEGIRKEQEGRLVKAVRELSKDSNFRNLKTQRAMMTYASENIEAIEELDPKILRKEIQTLYDKLK